MLRSAITAAAIILLPISVHAASNDFPSARLGTSVPQDGMTVTDWYKQNVYDPNDNKIGEIMDVLVDKSGRITTLIVVCRRLPRGGRKGRRRAVWGSTSDHEKCQEVVLGDEHDQGKLSEKRAWL